MGYSYDSIEEYPTAYETLELPTIAPRPEFEQSVMRVSSDNFTDKYQRRLTKNRKVRTTITREKLCQMNRIFKEYLTVK